MWRVVLELFTPSPSTIPALSIAFLELGAPKVENVTPTASAMAA